MTSHTSHSVTAVTLAQLPQLYRPSEIAEALGVSEWWVKEQARQGRIPFTKPAGSYRFTAEHFAEIVRLFEERPGRVQVPAQMDPFTRARTPRRIAPTATPRLRARRPRRGVRAESEAAVA
ncbi:helix-turn-helix domain-containing protein [Streptomyces sp. NPDC051214]|uniref:helix-turn-helix domain-containing protein n=1 Tax=Streptomyces sp. NPDC051214 TaxID=3155282 RepID=UPI0034339004